MRNLKKNFAKDPDRMDIRKLVSNGRSIICEVTKHKMRLFGSAGKC